MGPAPFARLRKEKTLPAKCGRIYMMKILINHPET